MASQRHRAADLAGAEDESRQAMILAQRFLEAGRSDEQVSHARFLAARWLLSIQEDRGRFDPARCVEVMADCDQALRLNPDNQDLQEDWLGLRFLCAEGGHPGPEGRKALQDALAFLGSRLKEPLSPGLAQARILVLWAAAGREEPATALVEALGTPSPAPFLRREYLGRVLNAQARAEAARGVDPRPRLDQALGLLQARLQQQPDWSLTETLAETWLIRGEWELAQGLPEAGASLRRAEACSDQAVQANPGSAFAQRLSALVRLRELKTDPDQAQVVRAVAVARLRAARALHSDPQRQPWLQRSLQDAFGGM
jgi:tetratricopeptide (TPR) repeat protein